MSYLELQDNYFLGLQEIGHPGFTPVIFLFVSILIQLVVLLAATFVPVKRRAAEDEGFEPSVGCPTHAFQACALGRYANPPVLLTRLKGIGGDD